ncbi:MAG: hypothetical protein M3Z17_00070 [Gemmatimonadota bacterium]|nr:hypothetical protein [Gemmatimonadota bacterium]
MNRKAIAVVIVLMWIGGFAWMLRRNYGGDVNRRLTEAAIRIQPASFYYSLTFRGQKIGAASSVLDTLVAAFVSEDYYTGRFPSGDSLIDVSARLRTRLSRGFRATDVSMYLTRAGKTSKLGGFVQNDSTLVVVDGRSADSATPHLAALSSPMIPPGLIGVALLAGDQPKVGRTERFVVFNPISAKPERREIRVAAESLFTVIDSAGQTRSGEWLAAHSDTVRAWRLEGDASGLRIWIDAEGRVVEAGAPNGLLLRRTAFELAFDRAQPGAR